MISIGNDPEPSPKEIISEVALPSTSAQNVELLVENALVALASCLEIYNDPDHTDAVLLEQAEQHAKEAINLAGKIDQDPVTYLLKVKLSIATLYTSADIPELIPFYLNECLELLSNDPSELSLIERAYFTSQAQNSLFFLDRYQEVVDTSTNLIGNYAQQIQLGLLVALYVNLSHAQHCLNNTESVETLKTISSILETDSSETVANEKSYAWLSLSQRFSEHTLWQQAIDCALRGLEDISNENPEEAATLTANLLRVYTISNLQNEADINLIADFLSEHSENLKSYLVAECWGKVAIAYTKENRLGQFDFCIERGLASIENLEDRHSIHTRANLLSLTASCLYQQGKYEEALMQQTEAYRSYKEAGFFSLVQQNKEEILLINIYLGLERYDDACEVAKRMYSSNSQANLGVLEMTPTAIVCADTMRNSAQYTSAMKLLKIARKNLLDILPSHLKEIFDFKKIREFSKSVLRTDVNQEAIEQNTDLVKALKLLVNVTEKLEYLLNTIEVDPKRLLCLAWQNLHLKLLLLPEMAIVDKASAKVDFASVCIDLNKSRLAFKYLKEAQRDLVNFSAEELETNPFIKELISIQKIHLLLDRDEVDLSRVPKLLRNIARRIGKINPKNLHVHCLLVDADYYCALKQYHLIDNDANKKLLIRKANNLLTFHDQWIRRPSKSIMELHNLLADLADKSHKPKLARQHRREAIKIGDYLLEAN